MNSMKREMDFIRGKAVNQPLGPKRTKSSEMKSSSSADQLFEVRKRKSSFKSNDKNMKKMKKKKTKTKSDDSLGDEDKVIIESMSLSRLPEGIIIYGCIQDISDFDIKFSLCGGIIAKVSITNVSNSYTSLLQCFAQNESIVSQDIEVLKPNGMFKIGQYFPIKILSKSEKSKGFANIDITASLNPRDIYSQSMASSLLKVPQMPIIAAVDSVEDHGFVMDIGFDGIKAFLPKDKAQTAIQAMKGRQTLSVGQLVFCAIDSVVNERSVRLTTKSKSLSKFKLTSDNEVNIHSLIPGLTVSAIVMNVTEKGLELNVINEFKAFVNRNHLKTDWDLPKNIYKIGDKVEGTILYVNPNTKHIALSLKPKLDPKSVKSFLQNVKIGNIYENAVVMGRDGIGNVVFKLPNDMKAICHKKQLFDKELDDLDIDTKFGIGSKHRCRVKSINIMDGLVVVTLRQSALDIPTVSVNDLKIGSIIKGKVKKLCKNGIVVQIGFGIRGFVPNIHLTETGQLLKNREQLFTKGKVVKCRIFRLDTSSIPCKVSLTCKKSLVTTKLNVLSSYEDAIKDFETDGVVVLILKKGILVEFFNGVKGFIPLKYLSSYHIEYPEKVFTIGQIVRCSVVNINLERERITCSLIKVKDNNKNKNSKLIVGQILKGLKVSVKSENGFDLSDESNDYKVFIPFGHLSDDKEMSSLLSEAIDVGDIIEEVMVFSVNASLIVVTRKQIFINSSKNNTLVSTLKGLEPNLIVPVVINGFASFGIFVELPANIKGLVSKRYLTDGPIDEPNRLGFALHQTLFARFIQFEDEKSADSKGRLKLDFSIKLSHVWDYESNPFGDRVQWFGNYIKDLELALNLFQKNNSDIYQKISHFRIGQIVCFKVIEEKNSELICEVKHENQTKDNSVKGIAIRGQSDLEKDLKIGSSGQAVIIDIDFNNKMVYLMIRSKFVKQVKNSYKINAISSAKCEQTVKCLPIHICKQFILVLLSGHLPGLIAYIPAKRHPNDVNGISTLFDLNECYHAVIKDITDNRVIAVLNSESVKNKVSKISLKDKIVKNIANKPKERIEVKTSVETNVSKDLKKENNKKIKTNDKSTENQIKTKTKRPLDSDESEDKVEHKVEQKSNINSKKGKRDVLKVNEPFVWAVEEATPDLNRLNSSTNQLTSDSDSDETDSEDNNQKIKKTREERNEEVRHREELLREKEEQLMDTQRKPETADDFERSVLSSPNSSLVWLKYMAFHLEESEVGKARAVAERALKTISFREEQERLNIWFAFLNLENLYGTQQSLDELFGRALQVNEPVVIYNHLADIYSQSDKPEETEEVFNTMLKKFKQNKNVWINFGLFYMKSNRLESARSLLQRSLTCLEKREHMEVISKFAQMEFKWGDKEQGKTLFEKVLANFPKRVDLWSVYIDMMLKYVVKKDNKESEDSLRNIFERVITFKLSAKRMKFIFKRYIDFEKQLNNDQRIERIKEKAIEYIEGKTIY